MAYEDVLYGQDRAATTDDWEQSPWINNFAVQGALTGLQYLGDTLSKPKNALFGAVGGLLDGDPLEAVKQLGNLIPLSDTIGLTNTKGGLLTERSVSGHDLLKKTGIVDDQTPGGGFAGFALDVLADPANWLTFGQGALTKEGVKALKAGTIESTLLGRIKTGQGGLMGIANKPWYAELLGGAPAENIAVLGMGKGGEAFASGLDKGVSAATRFTIPGTDFAPIGALRAAFSKGSGNTGYGPIVDEFGGGFGKTNVNRIEQEMATASRREAFPALDYQSEAINDLMATGMAQEDIAGALSRAGHTEAETFRMKLPQNLTPQQEQIIRTYGQKYAGHAVPLLQKEKAAAQALGYQIEDTSNIWGHRYINRAQAGMGNAANTASHQRTPFINDLPGGSDMFEQWAINPQFSGIATRKVAGQAYDGAAIQAAVKQNAADMAQEIMSEAQQQLAVMQQQGLKIPQRALDIAANTNGAADNLAAEAAGYISKLDPKIVDRGMFYRQDLGSNTMAYGANMAPKKAVLSGTLNVLAKEGKDLDTMLMKANNTNEVMSLKQAIEELKMTGAEQELMNRIPGMASVDDLASRGVPKKLVDKLKQEVNPGDVAGENWIDKMSSAFRYGVTIPFPANFFRNWGGELAHTAVAGQNPVRGLGDTISWYNRTLPHVVDVTGKHTIDDGLGTVITHWLDGKKGSEKELIQKMSDLLSKQGRKFDPTNFTITDIPNPNWLRAGSTEREGLITGVLGTDQVRAMLGTGTHNGERMLNYNPTPSMRTTGEIARDFAKPITSAAKRAEMEITPLKELAGVPTGQPPSSAAGKAVAALGDYVVDPVRGYMASMETAHAFQNKATRHQMMQRFIDQGYSPEGAAKRVLTTQRDYCVDEETEALTQRGWLRWNQITTDDKVLSIDQETRDITWSPVSAVNVFDHDGPINHWKTSLFDSMCTDNHKWLCTGSGLAGGDKRTLKTRPKQHMRLAKDMNRGHNIIIAAGGNVKHSEPIYHDNFVELAAWVITEGSYENTFGVRVSQSMKHNPQYVKRIRRLRDWCASNGWTATEGKPRDQGWGMIHPFYFGKGIGEAIKKALPNKQVPMDFLMALTPYQLGLFIKTMIDGDGHRSKSAVSFAQKDKGRTDAFQAACSMAGMRTSISKYGDFYRVAVYRTPNVYTYGLKKTRPHYKGIVWCPTTSTGTWMSRRNGVTCWTGNSNLTDFERKYMRNLVPFWNFTKQNAISQADMIARNPGRYNAMLQTVNSGRADDSFVPSWASSGTAIPIPGAAEGQQRFIGNLGLPVEDEAIGALGALLSGSPGEAVRRAASSSNPILKTIYETATGRQVFSGRDLEDLKPSPVVSALLGDNKFSRGLTQAVTGTPMSRSLSTVDRLVNSPEKGILSTLLNLGTGIRTVDVDQDQAAGIAARQQIERLMMESGQFKKRENVYLNPELRDQKDQLPPEVQELMQYHQALLKRAQDAAKLKALADSPR